MNINDNKIIFNGQKLFVFSTLSNSAFQNNIFAYTKICVECFQNSMKYTMTQLKK